ELKLDVYRPSQRRAPTPVLLFIHGGGWVSGSKDQDVSPTTIDARTGLPAPSIQPFLRGGLAFVSVEYRLGAEAAAPAAVGASREALRWLHANGAAHGLDPTRIVPMGASAGGHLALMVAFGEKATAEGVVGVIDLFGITDVTDVVEGSH